MAETPTETETWRLEARSVGIGSVAGVVGGIGMGLLLQLGTDILPVLGAFAGESTLLRGWLVHLVISAIYGAVFAAIMGHPTVRRVVAGTETIEYALAGITYAVMVAAVSIAVLPFVLELPWVTDPAVRPAASVPGPGLASLTGAAVFALAHIVYGAILGTAWGLAVGGD